MAGDAGAGAVSGAVQGYATGGPVGAVLGAVGGFFSGQASARARVYATRAAKTQKVMQAIQGAVQRRELVRQGYIARAEQLAAAAGAGEYGTMSSGFGGAMGSLMSRTTRNIQLFDAFARDQVQANFWLGKAEAKSAKASNIQGLTQLATTAAGFIPQGQLGIPGGAYWEKNVKPLVYGS